MDIQRKSPVDYLPGVPCSIQEQGMEGETMTLYCRGKHGMKEGV
jgi:hypothetical protein